ncbi:MAG: metallophosphoesterase [Gemmatimonadales bacterium]
MALAGCGGGHTPPPAAPPVPRDSIAVSIFLIGDAGAPYPDDPVLAELTRQSGTSPAGSVIAFLGDNLYPRGLPDSTDFALRLEMERRLDNQVAVARTSKRKAFFIPGNHDWSRMGVTGWDNIKRSQRFIRVKGEGFAEQRPRNGCPGPEWADVGTGLRLVFIDTQWWLHGALPKPRGPDTLCLAKSEEEFEKELTAVIKNAGNRAVIVTAHHPLATAGEHGGHFTIWDHVFPLREVKNWLWIPLPLIGSLYPAARTRGISDQDINGRENRRMRAALERALKEGKALLYAAGHDHNLQIFKGPGAEFTVVSGAGYFGHTSPVGARKETAYRAALSGFMRVDLLRSGSIRLSVITVGTTGAREAYAIWLKEAAED